MSKILNLAINNLSFGNISTGLLHELYQRDDTSFLLSDIGQPDLSVFDKIRNDDTFITYLNDRRNNFLSKYSRNFPRLSLWHVGGSETSTSNNNTLLTFFELDNLEKSEVNILNNQNNVIVTCQYTKDIFIESGVKTPIHVVPLFFDHIHYQVNNERKKVPENVCVWSLGPIKWERRKWTEKTIKTWIKKFGNNPKHILNVACFNPFMSPEDNQRFLMQVFEGKQKPFNVNIHPYLGTLTEVNNYLNVCDIVLEPSGAEGFSLSSFHTTALGKHCLCHNVTGQKQWANETNSVLFEPDCKVTAVDNIFFRQGGDFNQGNIYSWSEDSFIDGLEKVYSKWQNNKVNTEGLKLQEQFSRKRFADSILEIIE